MQIKNLRRVDMITSCVVRKDDSRHEGDIDDGESHDHKCDDRNGGNQ